MGGDHHPTEEVAEDHLIPREVAEVTALLLGILLAEGKLNHGSVERLLSLTLLQLSRWLPRSWKRLLTVLSP